MAALISCSICLSESDAIKEPVVSRCGHLFCWPCIFKWAIQKPSCPLCKHTPLRVSDEFERSRDFTPLYNLGTTSISDNNNNIEEEEEGVTIPPRPCVMPPCSTMLVFNDLMDGDYRQLSTKLAEILHFMKNPPFLNDNDNDDYTVKNHLLLTSSIVQEVMHKLEDILDEISCEDEDEYDTTHGDDAGNLQGSYINADYAPQMNDSDDNITNVHGGYLHQDYMNVEAPQINSNGGDDATYLGDLGQYLHYLGHYLHDDVTNISHMLDQYRTPSTNDGEHGISNENVTRDVRSSHIQQHLHDISERYRNVGSTNDGRPGMDIEIVTNEHDNDVSEMEITFESTNYDLGGYGIGNENMSRDSHLINQRVDEMLERVRNFELQSEHDDILDRSSNMLDLMDQFLELVDSIDHTMTLVNPNMLQQ